MDAVEVSLHAFFTSPLDGGEWSTSVLGHSTPGERNLLPIEKEIGWSTEQIWTFWRRGNCSLNKQVQDDRTVYISNLQVRHPRCVDRITSISKMQSNTTFNVCIAKRFFYIACFNNMFWPSYRPSSGCTLSYYKANNTIYNVLVFVNKILCTSIEFSFKIIIVAVE